MSGFDQQYPTGGRQIIHQHMQLVLQSVKFSSHLPYDCDLQVL